MTARDRGKAKAAAQLREAAAARKCWGCGCLHQAVAAIEQAMPERAERPADLDAALCASRQTLIPVKYDCLGCEVCYPAIALDDLQQAGVLVEPESCPTAPAETRDGWPPLPGNYVVRRYRAPVAVCTLTDQELTKAVDRAAGPEVAMVGTLQTENLGIERLILNVLANPNIRFLVVCGADSRQAIGHLPGQSLLALARAGMDESAGIVGARGKRPVLRNVGREAVEHFRETVEVVDLVGSANAEAVLHAVAERAARYPGPAAAFSRERTLDPVKGYVPARMMPDPAGYFVVYVDRARRSLSLEHYRKDGVLDGIIEGHTAPELYTPAVERGLLSRLDHAAYLGRELARAEAALDSGAPYVQDAAPERRDARPSSAVAGCCSSGRSCAETPR
jgi:tetrahydromethanopterin S-methyltransferase subunit A